MNLFHNIAAWITGVGRAFAREFSRVVKDPGVLIFFIGLPLLYPIIYTLIYNPEVVREIPVAVVDQSMTSASRSFVRQADATPAIEVFAYCPNMADARQLMAENKVFGIMRITPDYEKNLGTECRRTSSFMPT